MKMIKGRQIAYIECLCISDKLNVIVDGMLVNSERACGEEREISLARVYYWLKNGQHMAPIAPDPGYYYDERHDHFSIVFGERYFTSTTHIKGE